MDKAMKQAPWVCGCGRMEMTAINSLERKTRCRVCRKNHELALSRQYAKNKLNRTQKSRGPKDFSGIEPVARGEILCR